MGMANPTVTVIIPAYNEANSIADTIKSVKNQSYPPTEIIVVDDFSSDKTGEIARSLGVKVLRSPRNQGSKSKAQNYALPHVKTDLTVAVDADTMLAPDALEKMIKSFIKNDAVGACSTVIPQRIRTIWERGRFIEYLYVFGFFKPVQNWYRRPLICSGCFSMYYTKILKANGGYPTRTITEDVDLTWSLYFKGERIIFVKDSICYPIEPSTLKIMCRQLRRWSHGFHQNIRLHWRNLIKMPRLRWIAFVTWIEGIVSGLFYLIVLPILTLYLVISQSFHQGIQYFLFSYFFYDLISIAVPVVWKSHKLKMLSTAIRSLPSFFILRIVTSYFFLRAFIMEFFLKKSLRTYEKGH